MNFLKIRPGDLVRNTRTGKIGLVLVRRIDDHYFKVFHGQIDEWFGSNIEMVTEKLKKDKSPIADD